MANKSTPEAGWRVWNNAEVAAGFTETRRGGMLGYAAQEMTLLRLMEYVAARPMSVLDVGCGDGVLMQTIMQAYPVSRAVAIDGSPGMLEKAVSRFQSLGLVSNLVEFIEADFSDSAWLASVQATKFDVVVSGFAIHHVEDGRKREIYAEIYSLLASGGLFVNLEHVASVSPRGEEMFERSYAESIAAFRRTQGSDSSATEVYAELVDRPDKAANRLAPVDLQVAWLQEIGYQHADCYWKHFELAILAGYKPTGNERY